MIIGSKDELATFLALLYYLSRLCMQKYMLASSTMVGELEYVSAVCFTLAEHTHMEMQIGGAYARGSNAENNRSCN